MKALLLSCLLFAAGISQAQVTSTLLSQSTYYVQTFGAFSLQDSVLHRYSTPRLSYSTIAVDDPNYPFYPTNGVFNADTSYTLPPASSGLQPHNCVRVFNSAGLLVEYREKEGLTLVKHIENVYNPDMTLDTSKHYDNSVGSFRYLHAYQNGQLIARVRQVYEPFAAIWEDKVIDSFFATGTDSTYVRHEDLFGWYEAFRHHYIRDANKKVLVDSYYEGTLLNIVTFTSYDGSGRRSMDSVFYGSGQAYHHKSVYLYDNSNLGSITHHIWYPAYNDYMEWNKDTMSYNSHDQLTAFVTLDYFAQSNIWHPKATSFARFYYYGDPLSVPEVPRDERISIYPVPATGNITLQLNFSKPEKFTVRITDLEGRVVRQWEEAAQTTYKKKIQLDGMAAGNYVVHVLLENYNITKQFGVIH